MNVDQVTGMSNIVMGILFVLFAIHDRKISENSAKVYNTFVNDNGGTDQSHHIYKYFDKDGEHIASKVRKTESKDFWVEGDLSKAVLFGENLFGKGGKYVTVVEGELDAMSAYELLLIMISKVKMQPKM